MLCFDFSFIYLFISCFCKKDKRENLCVINVINDLDYSVMFLDKRKDKRKDKRENFRVINAINDSNHSFIFFRQRNTTEFKLKNFIKIF